MKAKMSISILVILALIGVSLFFLLHHPKKIVARKIPPTVVYVQAAQQHDFPLTVSALGQVVAPKTIMLKTKTAGAITHIYFEQGDTVKEGQPLLQIDDAAAKANLAEKQANYASLKTQYQRYLRLQKKYPGAVSQDTLSQTLEKMNAAKADVNATKQALIDTLIRAPFSGTIGRLQATTSTLNVGGQSQSQATPLAIGTYLPSDSPIAILSNASKVDVQYQIPQTESQYLKTGQTISVSSEAYPNKKFSGQVIAISPIVYENSQTYEVVARVENINLDLRSGMKVFVTQTLIKNHQVLAIPGISLVPSLSGYSVYMIEDHKVKAVPVTIGERDNELISITSGLKAGDKVITTGIEKVQPGTHVTVAAS